MKKLIYSAIVFLSSTFLFGFCLFVSANDRSVDYTVPVGVYEWNYDLDNFNYIFPNLDFIVFNNNQDDIIYHNFSYECDRYSGISNYKYFGYNWWDEEWELGIYNINNGEKLTRIDTIRTKNKIPLIPYQSYYFYFPSSYSYIWVCKYDSSGAFIGNTVIDSNSIYVNDSETCFITFYLREPLNITSYDNNICINISNSDVNGNYYPYYSESRTDFNYRCIQMLSSYTPLTDDNAVFLKDILVSNNHIKSVVGWYRFNNANYLNSTYSVYWRLTGTLSNPVNQSSYNFATFDAFYVYYNDYFDYITTLDYYDYDADRELTGYARSANSSPTDSWYYTQGFTILLDNQYVAEEVFDFMTNNGAFSYIGDFNDSTPQFADVVNTIISVPINYLRQLFNIQLLGTSLFIILCSIMTIALVIFVIKKI